MSIDQQLGNRQDLGVEKSWRDHASCRFVDPAIFFPTGEPALAVAEIEAAKEVCRTCPVQASCLRFAFENKQEHGIWGGTDEVERRRLRRAWLAGRRRRAG